MSSAAYMYDEHDRMNTVPSIAVETVENLF
ncbi:MAG: hypothetical protein J07HQW2_02092 [Haloquadratum walsbyi J07HQW2]|uniref:Uncharacterized protein n=1 Tax=Haloquadratum walsbyi J07HQW2 TaxID=1238425 RepID=U1NFN4_9EURY|nr:MAG: hypothetical protein J07HQW2_02092 [Haloquadratum walsbyi J07HQW2]